MLVLASKSPRRSELLRAAGFEFTVRTAEVDESIEPQETPEGYVRRLAEKKAMAVTIQPAEMILGADTIVVVGDEILGKPRDEDHARAMLEKLSGRRHDVYTGVCLRTAESIQTSFSCTGVWFDAMDPSEIDAYVRSGEPLDKAGAYAIQGLAAKYIPRVDGSYSNVVGLPVDLVQRMMKERAHGLPSDIEGAPRLSSAGELKSGK
jgi:septum formation protein